MAELIVLCACGRASHLALATLEVAM